MRTRLPDARNEETSTHWEVLHPHWLAVKTAEARGQYWFYPMVADRETESFTIDPNRLCSTIDEMVTQGVELILEVDAVPSMRNPRILFDRYGVAQPCTADPV